ncbi:2'-5' RNA ligase family protein [Gryllotalpicola koreensis]
MTDPALLEPLNGQQYLVLRPAGRVAEFYESEQARLKSRLPTSISHPHTGHVTLRGFYEPTRVRELRDAIAAWAARQTPIEVQVEAVDGFPTPFQIFIARLNRNTALIEAYAGLTAALDVTDFQRIGELPLEQWVFHVSLIYCGALSNSDWEAAHEKHARDVRPRPSEVLTEAEFVWYENGTEHAETITLSGNSR